MSGLDKLVEELGGNFLLGGAVIQFSDAIFIDAFKTIYEAGAAAEREACAALCDAHKNPIDDPTAPVGQYESGGYIMAEFLADAIRVRGSDAT